MWAESLLTQNAWAWKRICGVASGRTRRSHPDDYSGGLCSRSNRLARGALYQISFCAEALHSFLTFTVGLVQPLCEASWLPVCAEAPAATLEKPDASDSHWLAPLVCSVWPVPLEEESGPITSRRSETNMMSPPCSAITGCRWEGAGPLGSLNTKQECIKPGIKYPPNMKVFPHLDSPLKNARCLFQR